MKQTIKLFLFGLQQISQDGMLLALLPAPFLAGLVFRLGIPFVNNVLENQFTFSLVPWYGLVDGLLICLSPMLIAMVSAFLLLEERDEGISAFYQITPTQGYSYLTARIGIPILWAFLSTVIAGMIFRLSGISMSQILITSVLSSLTGIFLSMMIVSMAGNKVEGLAFSKLTGISLIGLILVWFVPKPYQLFGAILPSYWIGVLIHTGISLFSLCCGLLSCLVWIFIFTRRFMHRVV